MNKSGKSKPTMPVGEWPTLALHRVLSIGSVAHPAAISLRLELLSGGSLARMRRACCPMRNWTVYRKNSKRRFTEVSKLTATTHGGKMRRLAGMFLR